MQLIILSHPTALPNECNLIETLLEQGLNYFHLRKPSYSKQEIKNCLNGIATKYHSKIILHTHFDLLNEYELKGIHLNLNTIQLGANTINAQHKSFSFHTIAEIEQCKTQYNYVFLSPIFNSISKPHYKSILDTQAIQQFLKQRQQQNIIALGGIDETRIEDTYKMGFNGIAAMGSIWNAFLKNKNKKELVDKFNIINKQCQLHAHIH